MKITQWSILNKNRTILINEIGDDTVNLKQIFGKNVRYYRFVKKLTQEEFAEHIDMNASYVSEIENGKYGPTFENIEVIAKVLNVKPYLLFQENSNTHKKLPNRVDMKRF